jgi:hypothetical protein
MEGLRQHRFDGWQAKPILALLMAKSIAVAASPVTEGMKGGVGWLWGVLWALQRRQNIVERVERAKMAVFCARYSQNWKGSR